MFYEKPQKSGTIIIGCGGSGCNIAERLSVLSELEILIVNTDSKGLSRSRSSERILIGNEGGCSGDVKKGIRAAKKAKRMINEKISNYSQIVLMTGLGGGTGTGALQAIAKMAKKNGSNVISVVTLPMAFEIERRRTARNSLQNIRKFSDTLIILDGNRIREMDHSLKMDESLRVLNEMTCEAVMRAIMICDDKKIKDNMNDVFTTALAEAVEPIKALTLALSNPMTSSKHFSKKRMLVHMDGMLRSTDRKDIEDEVIESVGISPVIVSNMSSAKKVTIVLFIPLSCFSG